MKPETLKLKKITSPSDLPEKEIAVILPSEMSTGVKVPSTFLNSYFTTDETLKNYKGQLELNLEQFTGDKGQLCRDRQKLEIYIGRGDFQGIDLSYQENRAMKGIFALADKQGANEKSPFVILENASDLYEQILEKKKTKNKKDGTTFRDYRDSDKKSIDDALDALVKKPHKIVIKGQSGTDKKGKPLFFFYMTEKPLIDIEYLKADIPEDAVGGVSERDVKDTGRVRIKILPQFLTNYQKFFKYLPRDVSKEIRTACPEVQRMTQPLEDFINYLHRQDNEIVKRRRETIAKALRIEAVYHKNRRRANDNIISYYDIAKRAGFLKDYKLDQRDGTYTVDVLFLEPSKFLHLRARRDKAEAKALEHTEGLSNGKA